MSAHLDWFLRRNQTQSAGLFAANLDSQAYSGRQTASASSAKYGSDKFRDNQGDEPGTTRPKTSGDVAHAGDAIDKGTPRGPVRQRREGSGNVGPGP
jgi:hypothetical protein